MAVRLRPGGRTGDPGGTAIAAGDLAVEGHRRLEPDPRAAGPRVRAKRLVRELRALRQLTAGDDNLRWALGLEAERMVNMRMEKALLDTEMTVVRNAFERGENRVQNVLEERVVAAASLIVGSSICADNPTTVVSRFGGELPFQPLE